MYIPTYFNMCQRVRHPSNHIILYTLPHFLSDAECDVFREVPVQHFSRGKTVDTTSTNSQAVHLSRTSTTVTLAEDKQRLFHRIVAERLPDIWKQNDHEPAQLARYTRGQHYDYHHDYFDERALQSDNATSPQRQRTWTLLVYLDDGGPAAHGRGFPLSRRRGFRSSFHSRPTGGSARTRNRRPRWSPHYGGATHFGHPDVDYTVYPERGKAILWLNVDPRTGAPNPKTLHSGKALGAGCEKRIITQWFLEKVYGKECKKGIPNSLNDLRA